MRALRRLFGPLTVALALSTILSTGASAGRPPIALGLTVSPQWGQSAGWWDAELDILGTRAPAMMSMFFAWNSPKEYAPSPKSMLDFVWQPTAFPTSAMLDNIYRRGAVPVLFWQPNIPAGQTLQNIIDGEWDGYINKWARAAAADGRPMIIRFAQEMNAPWFAWGATHPGNTPEQFVQVWRKVWNAFRGPDGAGATNVRFMWAPSVKAAKFASFESVYPGDQFVQIIGIDGYNFYDFRNSAGSWRSIRKIFEASLDEIALRWPTKPVVIAEVGSVEDHEWDTFDKGRWLTNGLNYLYANEPQVVGFLYFNIKVLPENSINWRLDSSASATKAWKDLNADPRFQGTLSAAQLAAARTR